MFLLERLRHDQRRSEHAASVSFNNVFDGLCDKFLCAVLTIFHVLFSLSLSVEPQANKQPPTAIEWAGRCKAHCFTCPALCFFCIILHYFQCNATI